MSRIKTFSDEMHQQSSRLRGLISGIVFNIIPSYCLLLCQQCLSEIPKTIRITEPAKITSDMEVLRNRDANEKPIPAKLGQELRKLKDALSVSGKDSFATLKFFSPGKYLNLSVEARSKNNGTTLYSFPCTVGISAGAEAIVDWENSSGGGRGCERGILAKYIAILNDFTS